MRLFGRIVRWYTKDGLAILVGKSVGTLFGGIWLIDSIFGTSYLGITLIVLLVLFITAISFSPTILKALDKAGVVDLNPEEEAIRKGFGLITGIDDWIETVVDYIWD